MDGEVGAVCGQDPVRLLWDVPPGRLDRLAGDRRFLRRLSGAAGDLHAYLTCPPWYQALSERVEGAPTAIAYFSPEFGITAALAHESGGLCITAGVSPA